MSTVERLVTPETVDQMPERIARVREMVCDETAKLLGLRYGTRMRALLLTGSLSRGEPALLVDGEDVKVLGDADLIAIFEEHTTLPEPQAMQWISRQAEMEARKRRVRCKIGVCAVHPSWLRNQRASIFAYELFTSGTCVHGDHNVLSLIPRLSPSDIPLEDAWWTLCNRMIELLEVSCGELGDTSHIPISVEYRMSKLWLDMATSFLVFAGAYAPSYQQRRQILRTLADDSSFRSTWPFSLAEFSSTVSQATDWRSGLLEGSTPFGDWKRFCETVECAHALWRWELCRLSGCQGDVWDGELWEAWVRNRPARQNVRGWLHLWREQGWHASAQQLPHWLRLAFLASPRLWIYRIGSELFFQLPALLSPEDKRFKAHLAKLSEWLPDHRSVRRARDWRHLGAELVWNYNRFVVNTRS